MPSSVRVGPALFQVVVAVHFGFGRAIKFMPQDFR